MILKSEGASSPSYRDGQGTSAKVEVIRRGILNFISLPCQKLDGLKNLYECLDDVLQLPSSQQVLSNEKLGKWEEEVLDGSLRLLDIYEAIRDINLQMKESVQELDSSLYRKRCGDLANEVNSYMISKKHLNKVIRKCYKDLKRAGKKCNLAVENRDSEKVLLVKLIKKFKLLAFRCWSRFCLFFLDQRPGHNHEVGLWS